MKVRNILSNSAKLIGGCLLLYNLNSCSTPQKFTRKTTTARTQSESFEKKELKEGSVKEKTILKGENIKGKTILLPIKWYGDIKPYDSNSWLNGNSLMSIPEIYGKISAELKAVVNDKDTIDAYIKQAPLERILELYQKENKKLKTKLWKNEFLFREIRDSLFYNGITGNEDEFNNLKDGVYGFWYISSNKQASLPGIFVINKGKEGKEKPEKVITKKGATEKQITRKEGLESKLDVKRTRESKVLTPEEEKIAKESLREYNFDLGIGYDNINNGKYNLILRGNFKNFILGLEIGYGEGLKDPINGFNKMNVKSITPHKNDFHYLGLELGYNLGLVSLVLDGGLETNHLIIETELQGINNKIESYKENRNSDKLMYGFGADLNLGRIKLGGRIRNNTRDYYCGGKLMLSF
jgi:hypothetical protein